MVLDRMFERPTTRSEIKEMIKSPSMQLVNKADTQLVTGSEESLVATMERYEIGHSSGFVQEALKRATIKVPISTMDDEDVKTIFEKTVILVDKIPLRYKNSQRLT